MPRDGKKQSEGAQLLREFDFRKAVRGRYKGKFNRSTRITLRNKSGRILGVTSVGEALSRSGPAKPARPAEKVHKRTKIAQKSRSAD